MNEISLENYKLAYGKSHLSLQIPGDLNTRLIEVADVPPVIDFKEEVKKMLRNPIASPPLQEVVNSGESVVIIVSDITRLSYKTAGYLSLVIDELNQAGIEDEDITIVISTGIHRQQTPEEDRLVVGEGVYDRIKVENHDSRSKELVNLGHTDRGTEITVNRTVYEADRIILTGGISYHLLAGFGGGRKSIAPGVCGYDSIQQNHGLALATDSGAIHPGVAAGIVDVNPVSEDMFEIADKVGVDFTVNVVVNENKEYIAVVAGDLYQSFMKGCEVVERAFGIPIDEMSDLVISSCGGYPKDIQLYQSIKGLDNSAYAVSEGGVIILCTECSDGTGSEEFMKWFEYPDLDLMKQKLAADFSMPGFVALRAASIMAESTVILISSLADEVVKSVNMLPASDLDEAWQKAENILGSLEDVTIMPQSALTFPVLS